MITSVREQLPIRPEFSTRLRARLRDAFGIAQLRDARSTSVRVLVAGPLGSTLGDRGALATRGRVLAVAATACSARPRRRGTEREEMDVDPATRRVPRPSARAPPRRFGAHFLCARPGLPFRARNVGRFADRLTPETQDAWPFSRAPTGRRIRHCTGPTVRGTWIPREATVFSCAIPSGRARRVEIDGRKKADRRGEELKNLREALSPLG